MIRFDFETQSNSDLELLGSWQYSVCPTTRIVCMSHKVNANRTLLWVPPSYAKQWEEGLPLYKKFLEDERVRLEKLEERLNMDNTKTLNLLKRRQKRQPEKSLEELLQDDLADLQKEKEHFLLYPNIDEPFWHYDAPAWAVDKDAFEEAGGVIEAHSTGFEQSIWRNICIPQYGFIDIPSDKWRDSMAKLNAHALPSSLGDGGRALNCKTVKDETGKLKMLQVAQPRTPTQDNPDLWWTITNSPERYIVTYVYCINDTDSQYEISTNLPDLTPFEQKVWAHTEVCNIRGIGIDLELAEKALKIATDFSQEAHSLAVKLTNGDVGTLNQNAKLLAFFEKNGVKLDNLQKGNLEELETGVQVVDDLIKLRLAANKASTKKLSAMALSTDKRDSRIRFCTVYHGASTGREAGRLLQQQNFPKGSLSDGEILEARELIRQMDVEGIKKRFGEYRVLDVISSCLRSFIVPKEGNELISADFNAIEARVIYWLSGCKTAIDAFHRGEDLYVKMASKLYNEPESELLAAVKAGDNAAKKKRQFSKAIVLGAGFGMFAKKLHETCLKDGLDITYEFAEEAINTFRSTFHEVPTFWGKCEEAVREALTTRKSVDFNKCRAWYDEKYDVMRIYLPSGRSINYCYPRFMDIPKVGKDGKPILDYKTKKQRIDKNVFTFMTVNATTKQYQRSRLHGALIAQNITQAVARDVMVAGALRAERSGYRVVFKVHDELVTEAPKGFGSVKSFEDLLAIPPKWASDLPIKAEGWIDVMYKK